MFARLALCALVLASGCIDPHRHEVPPSPPAAGWYVVIVEETADRHALPPDQLDAMLSGNLRDYVQGAGGELRIIDDDANPSTEPEKSLLARRDRRSLPWLYVQKRRLTSQPLPTNLDAIKRAIEKAR